MPEKDPVANLKAGVQLILSEQRPVIEAIRRWAGELHTACGHLLAALEAGNAAEAAKIISDTLNKPA